MTSFLSIFIPLALAVGSTSSKPPSPPTGVYDAQAPMYPAIYSDQQKEAQRNAGRAIVKQINTAIAARKARFTVPPGVYRLPAEGPDHAIAFGGAKNFTLDLAHTGFILENGGGFLWAEKAENLAILGPAKFDADPLCYTQGIVSIYDRATGRATVDIMPGYEMPTKPKDVVDAFSSRGVYLENPSWANYTDAKVLDAAKRRIELKLAANQDIYRAGNLLAMRLRGSPLFLATRDVHGLTIQDIEIYTGAGFSWGGGSGEWKFLRVRGIPRPGTNRLYGVGGCQRSQKGGSVLFDGCEFGHTTDDLIDYGGGGMFMCVRQESPRALITWDGSFVAGDTLGFYAHDDFHPVGSAMVTAIREITSGDLQAEAHRLCKTVNKGRDTGDRTLRRVTLDRDVQVSPANFVENRSSNRAEHFTMRNCWLHDSGVRVMVQGFEHGLFENNRFERISGGLALTVDAWWWGGPVAQDITVRNNAFVNTTFRNAWGTGKAAIDVGSQLGPADPTRGVAVHGVKILGNTIMNSSTGAIRIANASDVIVQDNVITRPFTLGTPEGAIQLRSVDRARIAGNTVTDCPGANVAAKNCNALSIEGNRFGDAKGSGNAPVSSESCTNTTSDADPAKAAAAFRSFLFASEGAKKILEFGDDGHVVWEYPAEMSRDVWRLPSGNVLFCYNNQYDSRRNDNPSGVMEVSSQKKIVFHFQTTGQVWSCQRLADGNTLVGAASQGKLLIVDPSGRIVRAIKLRNSPGHSCLRNARQLAGGNFLVAEESAHAVREYSPEGTLTREIPVSFPPYSAVRLANGDTIACGQKSIVEVDAGGRTVWSLSDREIPVMGVRWFAGIQVLPDGCLFVCNAGGKVPLFEVNRRKQIVWQWPSSGPAIEIGHGIQRLDVSGDPIK